MVHRRKTAPARTVRDVGLTLLVVGAIVGGVPRVAYGSDDHYAVGNGRHNKNLVENYSPEFNHGIQHVTNTNVSGNTTSQTAFCKRRFRHCNISQRAFVRAR